MTQRIRELGLTQAKFSELVGAIYDCSLDTTRWEATLAELVEVFEGQTAVLSLSDVRYDRLLINRSVGVEPYWQERQREHLPEIHEHLGRALASWPSLDEPFIVSRQLGPEFFARSPYAQEVLKPQKISDIIQYFLIGNPTRFAGFAIAINERQGLIGPREIELGKLLLPHIRRSVVISNLLDARTIESTQLAETLDSLRPAVILVDEEGAIVHTNQAALHLLQRGDVLRDRSGILQTTLASASPELVQAIQHAAHDESGMGPAGTAIRLTPPDGSPLFASVLPLKGGAVRNRLRPAAVAAVLVGEPADGQDTAHFMALQFDLTQAETRVLVGLLNGKTLEEISSDLKVAVTTVRSHLYRIFSKTGVTRQAELVRLAMQHSPTAHLQARK